METDKPYGGRSCMLPGGQFIPNKPGLDYEAEKRNWESPTKPTVEGLETEILNLRIEFEQMKKRLIKSLEKDEHCKSDNDDQCGVVGDLRMRADDDYKSAQMEKLRKNGVVSSRGLWNNEGIRHEYETTCAAPGSDDYESPQISKVRDCGHVIYSDEHLQNGDHVIEFLFRGFKYRIVEQSGRIEIDGQKYYSADKIHATLNKYINANMIMKEFD